MHDKLGQPIPESLISDWVFATSVGTGIHATGKGWKRVVDNYLAQGDEFKRKHNLSSSMSKDIGQLVYELECTIPYAVCPFCRGKGCDKCHSRGWVSKVYWNQFVPKKIKEEIGAKT